MRLLLLDPGLSQRGGHNAAMLEEFAQHAAATPGFSVVCACAAGLDPRAFGDIACAFLPVFRVHGYSGFLSDSESHETLLHGLLRTCAEDLASLEPASFDLVLMPTAYPVHLAAVTAWLADRPPQPFACGLLMPPRFWASNARAALWLDELMREAITALGVRPLTVLYSEAPHYVTGATAVATPMLLPPWAEATADWVASQSARVAPIARSPDRPVKFGFFGAPTVRKGTVPLAELLANGLPAGTSIRFALPEGHEAAAAHWHDPERGVHARTVPRGNRAYLTAMAEVDAVLAFYDPTAYSGQMSGIVAEAVALGKPLLVAQGCDAIAGFLATHAPGSAVALPFTDAGLRQGMALPAPFWEERALAARAAARGVQQLKRMDRFLPGVGGPIGR